MKMKQGSSKDIKMEKESLLPNEVIVFGDFSEDYQFIVQDEIQSHYWSKEYCTLHPFIVYYLGDNENLAHKLFSFISNDDHHDTYIVY